MAHVIIRARRVFAELNYAQRRALEWRMGVQFTGPREPSRRGREEIARLQELWEFSRESRGQ
jgi:hypothetical protein